MEEKGWEKIKNRLPREFKWLIQGAKNKNKKGRLCGGMMMGIRKGMEIEEEKEEEREEGRMKCTLKMGQEKWRIIGLYVNGDMGKKLEGIRDWMEEGEEGVRTIIGGDFNARTGEKGGWGQAEERGEVEESRKSKNKMINGESRKLVFLRKEGVDNFKWRSEGN